MNSNQPYGSPPKIVQRGRGTGQTRFEKETAANGGKVDTFGDPENLGPWVLGDTIGKGSSGRVRLARHNLSGKLAAVKIIPKNIMFSSRASIASAGQKHEKLMLGIRREIVIMKLIDHPNIMSLYDVFEADNELYLLLEYIEGGELFDFLVSKGRLAAHEALKYFRQIIYGVDYCHRFNICHRDLKPENLLLDSNKNIKIADFGMAAMEIANGMLETSCGSPHYASPEIVAGKAYHGAASDIWSCGVVLYALLVGRLPFDDPNMRVLLQKVRLGRYEIPPHVTGDARDLIMRMLVVNPEERIQMQDIRRHPFFCMLSVPFVNVPEPPSMAQLSQVVLSEKDIDPACLHNLTILWHGVPEKKIVEALLSSDVRWEKGHYFLLSKYQQKAMEEYDEGYSFGFQSGKWEPPAFLIKQQTAANNRRREEQVARRQAREREREREVSAGTRRSRQVAASPVRERGVTSPSPRRTAPGIPFPGSSQDERENRTVSFREAPPPGSPTKRGSRSQSRPRPVSTVLGPRPPSIHVPPIVRSSTPVPKSPSPINVLIEEMDRMRMPPPPPPVVRRSTAPPESPRPRHAIDVAGTTKAMESVNAEIVRARFGFGNPERAEAFADSQKQGLGLSLPPRARESSVPGSPRIAKATLVYPPSSDSSASQLNPPVVGDPAVQKFFNDVAGAINNMASPPRPTFALRPVSGDPRQTLSPPPLNRAGSSSGSDYSDSGSGPVTVRQTRTARANTLDSFVVVQEGDTHIVPPTPSERGSKKHKPMPLDLTPTNRASTFGPIQSPMPSPLLTGSEFGKGQGWFTSLFNFKPTQHHFLSTQNISVTRQACARLLESYGASVAVEETADGTGVLKCYADKIYDVTGGYHNKSVRFRVQFTYVLPSRGTMSIPSTPIHSSGYPSSPLPSPLLSPNIASGGSISSLPLQCTFIQERGARSTLDAIAQRFAAEWKLSSASSAQESPVLDIC